MFGNFAKLDSPRRLVQFWQNFQTSLVLLIPNCTRQRIITYTNYYSSTTHSIYRTKQRTARMQRKKAQIIQFKQLLIKISFERARLFIVPISQGVGNTACKITTKGTC